MTQPTAHAGDARVTGQLMRGGPLLARGLVLAEVAGKHRIGVNRHGAKLPGREGTMMATAARVAVEDGAGRTEFDGDRDGDQQWQRG